MSGRQFSQGHTQNQFSEGICCKKKTHIWHIRAGEHVLKGDEDRLEFSLKHVQIKQKYKNIFDDGFNILKWLKCQITDFAYIGPLN